MIKTFRQLLEEYSNYSNPKTKIARLVKNGVLIKLKKDMYEDDPLTDHSWLYANYLISPSYISFHYILSFYSLIPERVYLITSATTLKKKRQEFLLSNKIKYSYQDIPVKAFNVGLTTIISNGDEIMIAKMEKAICDLLYTYKNLRSIKDVRELVFDDLRINEILFYELNPKTLIEISSLYPSTTLKAFAKMVRKDKKNGLFKKIKLKK